MTVPTLLLVKNSGGKVEGMSVFWVVPLIRLTTHILKITCKTLVSLLVTSSTQISGPPGDIQLKSVLKKWTGITQGTITRYFCGR